MNKRKIESRIKMEANQIEIPDLKQEILARIPNRAPVVKQSKKRFSFSIRFSYVTVVLVLLLLGVLFVSNLNKDGIEEPTTETPSLPVEPNMKRVSETEKAYAKQAATVVGFIGDENGIVGVVQSMSYISSYSKDNEYEELAKEINQYFAAVSKLLSEEDAVYTIEVLEDSNYMYKLTIENSILNDVYETVIYYSEEAIAENNKHKEDLDEISTKLSGIIVSGDGEFSFTGTKEVSEDECEIELIIKFSNNNYVKVSQEIEKGEREYEYKFYSGNPKEGHKAYKTVEIEIEDRKNDKDGKKDVEVEIEENGKSFEISFKYGKDNSDYVDVNYHNDNKHYEGIKIHEDEEADSYYRYDFEEGKGHSVAKPNGSKGHGKGEHH